MSDILSAGRAIERFTAGRSREDYGADLMLRSAVERQFEIVGEALRRLEFRHPGIVSRISEYRRIIAFRNLIATVTMGSMTTSSGRSSSKSCPFC